MSRLAAALECINFPQPHVLYPFSLNTLGNTVISGYCANSRGLRLLQTPVFHGHRPEKIAARDGLHAVAVQ